MFDWLSIMTTPRVSPEGSFATRAIADWAFLVMTLKELGGQLSTFPHGTSSSYTNHNCRCDACRKAQSQYARSWRASRGPSSRHGDYINYGRGCRCEPCRLAWNAYNRQKEKARREAPPKGTKCDLCNATKRLVLDHDHVTGRFRGWICQKCNLGLGRLGDSIEGLQQAEAYLIMSTKSEN